VLILDIFVIFLDYSYWDIAHELMRIWIALLSHFLELLIGHLFFVLIEFLMYELRNFSIWSENWEFSHRTWNLYLKYFCEINCLFSIGICLVIIVIISIYFILIGVLCFVVGISILWKPFDPVSRINNTLIQDHLSYYLVISGYGRHSRRLAEE
jgi:hypothetical protein